MNYKTICLILALIIFYLLFNAYIKEKSGKTFIMPADTLPEQVQLRVEITPGQIKTYTREKDPAGKEVVKVQQKYQPPEGKISVEQRKDGVVSVQAENKGFTLKLHAVAGFDKDFGIGAGARVFYWDRFGLGPGILFKNADSGLQPQPYIMADMRLAGMVKGFENSSVGIYYNLGQKSVGFAAAVYF